MLAHSLDAAECPENRLGRLASVLSLAQREGTETFHHLMRLFLCPGRLMMALFEHGTSRIHYEEHGSGDPVLSIG